MQKQEIIIAENNIEDTILRLSNIINFQKAWLDKISDTPVLCEVFYSQGEPAIWLKSSYVKDAILKQTSDLEAQRAAAIHQLDELVFGKK